MHSITLKSSSTATEKLFIGGNYLGVALNGPENQWQTFAAMGLLGKTKESAAGLNHFDLPEARFYTAVASWIGADDSTASHALETIATSHARNLLALSRRPRISVLARRAVLRQMLRLLKPPATAMCSIDSREVGPCFISVRT